VISLAHFAAQVHPRFGALRRRRDRRLGAMHASRPNALAYAAALTRAVVEPLAAAGMEAARALSPHWPPPRAADAALDAKAPRPPRNVPPVVKHEVTRALHPIVQKTRAAAPGIAHRTIVANLGHVDNKLGAKVKASLGIEIRQSVLRDQSAIYAAMNDAREENVDLITSIPDQYMDRLEEILADNWENNGSWEDAVGEIEDLAGVTQSRAELIARDQCQKQNSRFNEARQRSLGVTKYVWTTVGDDRVRESHQELEGQTIDYDDPPTDSDGNTGHAGDCGVGDRCTQDPVLDLDDFEDGEPDDEEEDDLDEEEPN
jgi:SPP1 gp7 family putative phage head morphogenesis protein